MEDEVVVGEVAVEVVGKIVGEVVGAGEVAGVVVDEVDVEVVHSDVVDSVLFVTTDTDITAPSTEPSVHIDRGFPRGLVDWSVFTEYADHMALRLWKRKVYVFYV